MTTRDEGARNWRGPLIGLAIVAPLWALALAFLIGAIA